MYCITPIPESQSISDPSNSALFMSITISALDEAGKNLVHASMTLGPKGGPSLVAEGRSCASASVKAARKRNSTICQAGRR
jgi:hypothetical protein